MPAGQLAERGRGRFRPLFLSFVAGLAWAGAGEVLASPWSTFLRADDFTFTGPVCIHEYLHDWHGPVRGDGDALTYNWFETGLRYGPFSLSYVDRYDYEIKASSDSALFYALTKNREPLMQGAVYAIDVRAYHHRSWGMRTAWELKPVDTLVVEPGLTILRGESIENGTLAGQVEVNASNDYNYQAQLSDFYSRDYILKLPVPGATRGTGLSLDLSLHWNPLKRWSLYAEGRDLYGYIDWRSAPTTFATATSATKHFDSSGYVEYSPTLSGIMQTVSYRQKLKPHGTLGTDWSFDERLVAGSSVFLTDVHPFWSLSLRRRFWDEVWLGAQAMPLNKAGGFSVQWRQLSASLLSDGYSFGSAHLMSAHLNLVWMFH